MKSPSKNIKLCTKCVHLERGLWVRLTKKLHERKCLKNLSADFAPTALIERLLLSTGCGPEAKDFEPLKGGKKC